MTDPARPGKDCDVREVYTFVDDNTQNWKCTAQILKPEKNLKLWK